MLRTQNLLQKIVITRQSMKPHEVICSKSDLNENFFFLIPRGSSNSTTGSPFKPNNMAMKNEIVERIKKDLVSNDGGRYTISPQDFSEIEIPLCESRSR